MGASIPFACQDWANTKAAYRFFGNERVSEEEILGGHFAATCGRYAARGGPIMVLHDTSEFSFQRRRPEQVGQPAVSTAARSRTAGITSTPSAGS